MKRKIGTVLSACLLFHAVSSQARTHLMDVASWAYQLQDISISQIAGNTTFELIVMDYSSDGSDEGKFTYQEITQIRNSGKKAISYISIGEAESYRFYWNESWDADQNGIPDAGAPAWLGNENPEWEGNYKVRFWNPAWQAIIFGYIDTIIEQGFDGIYMDIIDAYYYWAEEIGTNPYADSLMIQFVLNIREHISGSTDREFFVIPQNGEFITEEAHVSPDLKEAYFSAIDAIGVEDVFFIGDEDNNNPYDPDEERIQVLQDYLSHSKNVFSIEYITQTGLLNQYKAACSQNGFIPYATTRDLDTLHDGIAASVGPVPSVPRSAAILRNYPNPFNPSTTLIFDLPSDARVTVDILDARGRLVRRLISGRVSAGPHSADWDGRDHRGAPAAAGVYVARLRARSEACEFQKSIRMVMVK